MLLVVVVFVAGFFMGKMTAPQSGSYTETGGNDVGVVETQNDTQGAPVSETVAEGGATINSSNMTEGQRKLISALGLDPNNITVTAEMVACAEAKLGAARVEEIKNGATPSFSEGASLVVCYR